MSERLKRRKKPADSTPKETANTPEPLQPRFYDNEPAVKVEAPAAVETPVVELRRDPKPEREAASEAVSGPSAATASAEPRPRSPRRRRSRGGSRPKPIALAPAPETAGGESAAAGAGAVTLPAEAAPAQSAPTQTAAASARSKGTVVLAIGLPGSGKSSWFKRHSIHPLSSDLLRELLFDDAQEQRFQDLVFSNLRSMLKARLIARRPMNYVDATNLTPQDRHSWIKLAKDYGYDVQGLFFDVPLEVCMERHQRRGRAVPQEIMRKMAGKLRPPTFEEGFSKITVVRVKQKEEAAGM
jgi:predicted kinase